MAGMGMAGLGDGFLGRGRGCRMLEEVGAEVVGLGISWEACLVVAVLAGRHGVVAGDGRGEFICFSTSLVWMAWATGTVNQETARLPIYVNGKETPTIFDVLDTGSRDFVLGFPLLRRWSPRIDWKTGHFQWDKACKERPRSGLSGSPQLHETVAREGRTQSVLPERPQLHGIATNDNEKEGPEDGLSGRAGLLGAVELNGNTDELDAIPPQYRKYRKLFQEELETGLPAHSQFDYHIPLKEGQHSKFHRIYTLNRVQEAVLEEYLEENLRKGYIRPLTSPAGYRSYLYQRRADDYDFVSTTNSLTTLQLRIDTLCR